MNIKKHKKEESHVHSSKKHKENYTWQIVSGILLILLVISAVFLFTGNKFNDSEKKYLENATNIGNETKSFLEKAFDLENMVLVSSVYENNFYIHTYNLAEQLLQYCIQEDSKEKYKEYLYCFLEDGDTDRCLTETGISLDSLNSCLTETNEEFNIMESYQDKTTWLSGRYPLFLIHDEDNKKYDVKGSPTLVINGTVVSSSRDPQSMLKNICDGFITKPRACNEVLSSAAPRTGFGFEGTGSSNTAICG